MMKRTLLVHAATTCALGILGLTGSPTPAAAFTDCKFCVQGEACTPSWLSDACARANPFCIGDMACWESSAGSCPTGYLYIDCAYEQS